MITNLGKNVMAKYLIGQAQSYASHIAVGCGAIPVANASALGDYSAKTELDFEMFRVPIISRGYVKEDGITKIVLTAELPTQERYEITELGLYSAGSNPSATGFDSRTLYTFSRQEDWRSAEVVGGTASDQDLYVIDDPLVDNIATGDMADISSVAGDGLDHKAFQTNATNKLFANEVRRQRNEQLRYLNNMVMIRGNYSEVSGSAINTDSSYVYLPTTVNLQKNSSADKIKISFSTVNVINSDPDPTGAMIAVRFEYETSAGEVRAATATYSLDATHDFSNRYTVLEKSLGDFDKDFNFNWESVQRVKIYGVVFGSDGVTPSEKYYIALDAIRLENITSENPLYGLTGYSVLVTPDELPVVKLPNTSSLIEFRLGVGI